MAKYQSRLDKRSKKNTNKILNIMIAVVVLLILVVGGSILIGGGNDKSSDTASSSTGNGGNKKASAEENKSDTAKKDNEDSNDKKAADDKEDKDKKDEDEKKSDDDKEKDLKSEDDSKLKVQDGDEPNVDKTVVHPDWKPVGTSQSGEHVSSYDLGTPDWNEKVKALSYATGIPENNMTVWYIEGNGSPQKSIGTVSAMNDSQAYRVYLQWIDGEGWQPTKVQELIENDKN
ncbi:YrrS family protein [Rossellomorea marisflavi]|uniref:YrrS family protein n=1 Tax=Rossellomorea marisflavi TaxID=189381 RepID=UPI00296F942D|nr:YrrS family protein [Rossellomorea marisflavi]MDW4527469.1 YrrS family protein [Rossellomorea marisflavi]